MQRNKKKEEQIRKLDNNIIINILPIIFIVSILPLIVRYKVYPTGLSSYNWFPSEEYQADIFLYYKQFFFLITIIIMILLLLLNKIKKNTLFKVPISLFFLLSFGILTVISTLLSDNRHFGLYGGFEQFESMFTISGYCFIVFYIFYLIKDEQSIKSIFKYLSVTIIIFAILGISQVIGQDFITSDIGFKLVIPRSLWNNITEFQVSFKNQIALTLFNPNYVGVYTSLLIPIYASFVFTANHLKYKITSLILTLSLIFCLIGSQSKTGLISIVVTLIFGIIIFRKYIFTNSISKIVSYVVIIICLIVSTLNYNSIKSQILPQPNNQKLTKIDTKEKVMIEYNNDILYLDYNISGENNLSFSFTDSNNENVLSTFNQELTQFTITDDRFKNILISPVLNDDILLMSVTIDDTTWMFHKAEDETFYYLNNYGRLDKIITANSSTFTGYEKLASGRGYIWSRTIPLIKDNLLLGSGADSYVVTFPQQDYVSLHRNGFANQILTKPHSLYLQISIQSGLIALICFLIFYFVYFINSFKLYFNGRFTTPLEAYGVACFIGTVGYMISGITNDSSICVAPTFWVIIGLGITINYKLIKARKLST